MKYFLLLFLSYSSYSQTFGNYSEKGILVDTHQDLPIEKWFWTNNNEFTMLFSVTPIGLKHLHEKIETILSLNNMENDDPTWDNSYINPQYEDEEDYAKIHNLIHQGEGEIKVGYKLGSQVLEVFATYGSYKIISRKE